jgi:hypothetical protein
LTYAARAAPTSRALCDAIFAMRDVVPGALAASAVFRNEVLSALDRLATKGVRRTLSEMT